METTLTAPIANPGEVYDGPIPDTLYRFWFGACSPHYVYVWARRDAIDTALEEAAEYIAAQGWIGLFSEPDYADAARDLGMDWTAVKTEENERLIQERAETDHTYTESGWLLSWEWGVDEITDPVLRFALALRSNDEMEA